MIGNNSDPWLFFGDIFSCNINIFVLIMLSITKCLSWGSAVTLFLLLHCNMCCLHYFCLGFVIKIMLNVAENGEPSWLIFSKKKKKIHLLVEWAGRRVFLIKWQDVYVGQRILTFQDFLGTYECNVSKCSFHHLPAACSAILSSSDLQWVACDVRICNVAANHNFWAFPQH